MLKVGTEKLPPPMPIKTDKKPIKKLMIKFILFDFGISFMIKIGSCCRIIFIDIIKARETKMIKRISPDILLANKEPIKEPAIIPNIHFFTISIFTLPSFRCDLIEEIDVKHIIPNEEAIETCITISFEYPKFIKTK